MKWKTPLTILLAACMTLSLASTPAAAADSAGTSAASDNAVTYINADGVAQEPVVCTTMTSDNNKLTGGWYAVTQDVTFSKSIIVNGNVNLILCDGTTLTGNNGICVKEDNTLTIWAQSTGDNKGKLVATGNDKKAGIGGNDDDTSGAITINGGDIHADGDKGAGIGGGLAGDNGPITINGGTVFAESQEGGAGIGCGLSGDCTGDITIRNASVTAYGGTTYDKDHTRGGAGIGAGSGDAFTGDVDCTITITDSYVYAVGGGQDANEETGNGGGAGIGAGFAGNAGEGTINITDSNVTAIGGVGASGIGGGRELFGIGGEGGTVSISGTKTTVWAESRGNFHCAIGNGDDDSVKGSLTITGRLKVQAWNDDAEYKRTCLASDRVMYCQMYKHALIEVCEHPDDTYNAAEEGHTRYCDYCGGSDFPVEAHVYPEGESICSICGYGLESVPVTFVLNNGITEDITLYGIPCDPNSILPSIGDIPAPSDDKIFAGWDVNGEIRQPNTRFYIGNQPMTIYATWADKCTVTFDGNNGGVLYIDNTYLLQYPKDVVKGGVYTLPELELEWFGDGDKEFKGWQIGDDPEIRTAGYSFKVDEDTTLMAVWKDSGIYTITFMNEDGTVLQSSDVSEGETPVYSGETPTHDADDTYVYSFNGWDPEIVPASADVIYAATYMKTPLERQSVILKSANVEFQGKIRLQFRLSFPDELLEEEGAYVTLEKAGGITKIPVAQGVDRDGDTVFLLAVPAPEFADDVVVKVYYGNGEPMLLQSQNGTDYTESGFTYSVKTYAERMMANSQDEKMRALAKALYDYCTAAQIYFKYGDYSALTVDSAVEAVTLDDLTAFATTTSGTKPQGVTGAGISVGFESDNSLRISFKLDGTKEAGEYTFELDGEVVHTGPVVRVANIAAPNLDVPHTFSVSDGTDTYTITASAMSYARTSIKNGSAERKNLGRAFYLYNRAAKDKFGNNE